ncbi:MAG: GNAT family N-acetyltransferase [Candidatus Gracilibacteria bacterium]|nr:GNAT family N-acetyltransferase [Candidatus Gracilibacteria bacterium]
MIIRNATIHDLESCEKLSHIPELLWADGGHYYYDFLKNYISDDSYFLVLEDNNSVIGYLLGEKLKAGGVIIWSLGIDEKYRRKGLGTQLLKKLEYNAKKDGCKWIYLVGRANKEGLKKFYLKNGFSVGERNLEYTKNI